MSDLLHPLCNECGGILVAIIGTMFIVCVNCNKSFELVEREFGNN